MPTNGFLPFATAPGSNVVSDLVYAGSNARQAGFTRGTAASNLFNKSQLQASVGVSALMQFAVDYSGNDCLDSTSLSQLEANLRIAIAAAQAGAYYGVDTSGTANVVTVTLVPAPTTASFTNFQYLWIKVANTNTGPVKVQENAFAQRDWLRNDGVALQSGDLKAGSIYAVINDGTSFKLVSVATSQILPYTPAGAQFARAFTAASALTDFPGGATTGFSGPFTVAQSLTVTGASYLVMKGTCGFRPASSNGTDCRARIRYTVQGQSAVVSPDYQGCRPYSSTQITVNCEAVAQGLDRSKSVLVELIVDRTQTDAACPVFDPRINVQHDGNP